MNKEKKNPQYIGMAALPRYEQMIIEVQKRYAPISRTKAMRMLMDAGAKRMLKGVELPK